MIIVRVCMETMRRRMILMTLMTETTFDDTMSEVSRIEERPHPLKQRKRAISLEIATEEMLFMRA